MLSSHIEFGILEMPGQLNIFDPNYDTARVFSTCGALIYVIDCQTEYLGALQNLQMIIEMAVKVNPNINIEVLIHKIDGLSDDFRLDTQRDIIQRTTDELVDANLENVKISFHLTSIYDRSIHEAFSRIIQKLIPEIPILENLLNILCQHSGIEKAFLFDINSKIYVATDSSPVDPLTYEVCTDFIDVTLDLDTLYNEPGKSRHLAEYEPSEWSNSALAAATAAAITNGNNSAIPGSPTSSLTAPPTTTTVSALKPRPRPLKSISRMHNGIVLYLCQMIRGLALVGFIRSETAQKMALIDYNVEIFSQGLQRIWSSNGPSNGGGGNGSTNYR